MRHKVKADRFRYQCEGAGDQSLRCDNGCQSAQKHTENTDIVWEHLEKRVEIRQSAQCGIPLVCHEPGALAQIVKDQTDFDKGPAGIDIAPSHVADV